jgi:hypothetical protein
MDELIAAVRSLLNDIESMQGDGRGWFDGFSEYRDDGETVAVEWPNLEISADRVRAALDTIDGH